MPGSHDRLDACADAEKFVGLLKVFFDGALGDAQYLAGIARAFPRLGPTQAFELASTQDGKSLPSGRRLFYKLKHTHDAPLTCELTKLYRDDFNSTNTTST